MKVLVIFLVLAVALYSTESRSPSNDGRSQREQVQITENVDRTLDDLQKHVEAFVRDIEKLTSQSNMEVVVNKALEYGDESIRNTTSMINQTMYEFPRQYSELHNVMVQIKNEVHSLYQNVVSGQILPNEIAAQLKLKLDNLYPKFVEAMKSTFGEMSEQIETIKEKLITFITNAYDSTNPKIQKLIQELRKYISSHVPKKTT